MSQDSDAIPGVVGFGLATIVTGAYVYFIWSLGWGPYSYRGWGLWGMIVGFSAIIVWMVSLFVLIGIWSLGAWLVRKIIPPRRQY